MNAALLNPSRFIKAVEFLGRDVTLMITSVAIEELEDDKSVKKKKGLIGFAKTEKLLVLNVTNIKCLIQMFGNETDGWLGKRVTLFPEPNRKSESGVAIRVRGSPDLAADVKFSAKIGRDARREFVLRKTGAGSAKPARDVGDDGETAEEIEALRQRHLGEGSGPVE